MQWNKWIVRRVSNQRRPLLLKRVSARSAYPLDLSNAISCSVCLGDGSTHSDLGSSSKTWPSRPCLRRLFFWRTSSKELPHGLWRLFFSYICLDQVELPLCSLFSSSPTFLFFFCKQIIQSIVLRQEHCDFSLRLKLARDLIFYILKERSVDRYYREYLSFSSFCRTDRRTKRPSRI